MLDLSPDKLLMLAVVALVVLGPNRLPGAARTVGRFVGQMRAMTSSLQTEVRDALHEPEEAFTSALADFRPSEVRRGVRQAVTDVFVPPTPSTSAPGANGVTVIGAAGAAGAAAGVGGAPLGAPLATGWGGRPVPDDPGFN